MSLSARRKRLIPVAGVFCSVAALLASAIGAHAADVSIPRQGSRAGNAQTCKGAVSFPAYNGPIKQNATPLCFTVPSIGDIYVGGALTGYAYTQTNPFPFSTTSLPSDRSERIDFSNVQGFVQKTDGVFQFYVQAGMYAIPALGLPNYSAIDQTSLLFGPLPVAYGKIQINDKWSVQGGRMPTLIGSEAPFTFQNLNINRGLLFNQENTINHGIQVNYANGPWSISLAGTDGFFSGEISWFTGSVSYKLDDANTVGVNGGLNLGRTDVRNRSVAHQFRTPLLQQNSGILNLNYTYSKGPWTITPYFQFTHVERDIHLGILESASTYGGALLASYAFTTNFALAGRVEYERQTGDRATGTTSLLYGPGSSAMSFTVTPTYTWERYFLRGEYAHVQLFESALGSGFGRSGNRRSQDRFMLETGVTF